MVNRASAPDGGVRGVYPPQIYPGDAFVFAVVVAEGVVDFGQAERLGFGECQKSWMGNGRAPFQRSREA